MRYISTSEIEIKKEQQKKTTHVLESMEYTGIYPFPPNRLWVTPFSVRLLRRGLIPPKITAGVSGLDTFWLLTSNLAPSDLKFLL